jgi:hypothetical protein
MHTRVDADGHPTVPLIEGTVACSPELFGESRLNSWHIGTQYKPVDHIKRTITYGGSRPDWSPLPVKYCDTYGEDMDGFYILELPTKYLYDQASNFFPEIIFNPQWSKYPWNRRLDGTNATVASFKPSLNTGFSLVNFAIQWRDALSIYKNYISNVGRRNYFHHLIKQVRKGPTSALRALAAERLAYVYGTKQFVQDVSTILRILNTWKADADKFLADVDKYRYISGRISYDFPTSGHLVSSVEWTPFSVNPPWYQGFTYVEDWNIQGSVSLVYKYNVPEMKGLIARAAQLADSFGVSMDPSIIWDTIPYSFVVDWFYNVGEWLHRQRKDWVNAQFSYREFGASAKLSVIRQVFFHSYPPFATDLGVHQLVVRKKHTRYVRELRELERAYAPTISNPFGWSLTRILNATALAVQKMTGTQTKRAPRPSMFRRRPLWRMGPKRN